MVTLVLVVVALVGFGVLVVALVAREALRRRSRPTPNDAPWSRPRSADAASLQAQADRGRRGGALLGLLLVVPTAVLFAQSTIGEAQQIGRAYRSADWPVVEGRILSSRIAYRPQTRSTFAYWAPTVAYTYHIDGRAYAGEVWRTYPNQIFDPAEARAFTDRYRPGTVVQVRYDPRNPLVASLEPGVVSGFDYLGVLFGMLLALVPGVIGASCLRELFSPGDLLEGWESEAYLRYEAGLLREQPGPPRAVSLWRLVRLIYRPLDQAFQVAAAAAFVWLFSAPLRGTPAAPLVALLGLALAGLALWPLILLARRRFALRFGTLATARVVYASRWLDLPGVPTSIQLIVRAPAGDLMTVARYRGPGQTTIRAGATLDVLLHPARPTVLRVLPPSRTR